MPPLRAAAFAPSALAAAGWYTPKPSSTQPNPNSRSGFQAGGRQIRMFLARRAGDRSLTGASPIRYGCVLRKLAHQYVIAMPKCAGYCAPLVLEFCSLFHLRTKIDGFLGLSSMSCTPNKDCFIHQLNLGQAVMMAQDQSTLDGIASLLLSRMNRLPALWC